MWTHLIEKLQNTWNIYPMEIMIELKEEIDQFTIILRNFPHSSPIINGNLQSQLVSMPNSSKHLKKKYHKLFKNLLGNKKGTFLNSFYETSITHYQNQTDNTKQKRKLEHRHKIYLLNLNIKYVFWINVQNPQNYQNISKSNLTIDKKNNKPQWSGVHPRNVKINSIL